MLGSFWSQPPLHSDGRWPGNMRSPTAFQNISTTTISIHRISRKWLTTMMPDMRTAGSGKTTWKLKNDQHNQFDNIEYWLPVRRLATPSASIRSILHLLMEFKQNDSNLLPTSIIMNQPLVTFTMPTMIPINTSTSMMSMQNLWGFRYCSIIPFSCLLDRSRFSFTLSTS